MHSQSTPASSRPEEGKQRHRRRLSIHHIAGLWTTPTPIRRSPIRRRPSLPPIRAHPASIPIWRTIPIPKNALPPSSPSNHHLRAPDAPTANPATVPNVLIYIIVPPVLLHAECVKDEGKFLLQDGEALGENY